MLGLTLGPADRPPHAVFAAVASHREGRTVLRVDGLERRGREWSPWRRRACRTMYDRFLAAEAAEVARADPGATTSA